MTKLACSWKLDVDRGPNWLLIKVHRPKEGAGDAFSLADTLWSLLEQHSAHRLVLELDEVRQLDDDMIDQLLELHDRIQERGGLLRICGISPASRDLLLSRRVDDRFVPYSDREEAVLGSSAPKWPR